MFGAAAVTSATIGAAVPLFIKASEYAAQRYNNYGSVEMAEIQAIQKAYKEECVATEKLFKPTTLGVAPSGQPSAPSEVPIYLQMDVVNHEIPVLFAKNFYPNPIVADWTRLLSRHTHLRHSIEEMLAYICQYQQDRDKRWFGRGYNYDPANLFFEEFKCWLVELSKAPLNGDTLKVVKVRILYLNKLYVNLTFKQGKDKPTRADVIQKLLRLLETNIAPTIELALSRTSAREHFDLLKINVETLIKNTTEFLFYVFRDTEEVPLTFILEQLRKPTLVDSYKLTLTTLSGQLLGYLANSEPFLVVFPRLQFSTELVEYNYESVMKNDFVKPDGGVLYPLIKNNIHRYNWYKDQETQSKSGILDKFREQKVMDNFLRLHGLVQKACAFYVICDLLYELAGDGGNLMVYGLAAQRVLAATKMFLVLVDQIGEITKNLHECARTHFDSLIAFRGRLSEPSANWQARFNLTDGFYKNILEIIQECKINITNIHGAITLVQDPKYVQAVKTRIALFYKLIEDFSSQNLLSESEFAPLSSHPAVLFVPQNVNPAIAPAISKSEQLSILSDAVNENYTLAIQAYRQRKYDEAVEKFFNFLESNSEHIQARMYLAYSLAGCGYLQMAIEQMECILSELSEKQQKNTLLYQDALYTQSVFYKAGGLQQAEARLTKLLEINPDHTLAKQERTRIKLIQSQDLDTGLKS